MKFVFSAAATIMLFLIVFFAAPRNSLTIYEQSKKTLKKGYGNCDISKNGELKAMRHFLKKGNIVFDVGANQGNWSLLALQLEPTIKLYSFEPARETYETLKRNLDECPNVKTFNLAISDQKGECPFFYYPQTSEFSGFYDREVLKNDLQAEKIHVPMLSLEAFCQDHDLPQIDFLKIDTEGAEWKVLCGAKSLLKHHYVRMIQFEYGGCYLDAKTTLQQVAKLLTEHRYILFRIIPKGLVHISNWTPSLENFRYCNYIAICEEDLPGYPLMKFP